MIIDNIAGLQFLIHEDIFFVKNDLGNLNRVAPSDSGDAEQRPVLLVEAPVSSAPVVVVPPSTQETAAAPVVKFEYAGKNNKRFLVICCYPGAELMDDKHYAALISTLQRKELTLDDVAIINIAKNDDTTAGALQQYFKPERLLILGARGLLAGWNQCALNQLGDMSGIKALYTYSFAEMMGDRDKTKAFWEQMKLL
ncbi:hypothetical protein [Mucilaginibacter paludis]|uniref:Uncharacterized protein n=1 Tax=Mucilaginibacter paludis DSM 18603 TaxID=714943 RepID=H1Y4B2_9SPHI|nr:hypothetical protein [Mucilaginibacter paludis]EHQ25746.1 hypothetical protein Mucpa_1588 [Mucilaginibacter paludis DSM 18603]